MLTSCCDGTSISSGSSLTMLPLCFSLGRTDSNPSGSQERAHQCPGSVKGQHFFQDHQYQGEQTPLIHTASTFLHTGTRAGVQDVKAGLTHDCRKPSFFGGCSLGCDKHNELVACTAIAKAKQRCTAVHEGYSCLLYCKA